MRIGIASDHAGVLAKTHLLDLCLQLQAETMDYGPNDETPVDYPDYAAQVCTAIEQGDIDRGILLCGSGIGMSIAANRFRGIRAALCRTRQDVTLARQHNDANVLVLGTRAQPTDEWAQMIELFLTTPFEGGRHTARINKMATLPQIHPLNTNGDNR